MKKRQLRHQPNLPEKANKILNGILVVLLLVAIKIWYLAIIQHEKKQEEASRPQRRTVIERSERATIYDRFEIPLALNKVQYNAAISYGPIRNLPRWKWQKEPSGKRVKCFFRKEYIKELSQKLAEELYLNPEWIEDLIHSKGAILGNVPCIIKENISEAQYFRLKMLEKDWPGLHAEIAARRCYPLGPIGGEVVGYIGPISRTEYDAVMQEMKLLRELLIAYEDGEKELEGFSSIQEVSLRLEELEKKAYRINDFVGKMGVEASYDEALRGLCGKHIYLSDIRGNLLQKLPGSENPVPGSRLVLTLSSELQAFAQQLLAEYENEPLCPDPKKRAMIPEHQPWIKGGAIVALDPNTGEVLAMASFPTCDPNDFIRAENDLESHEKNKLVSKWLETDSYLAALWDQKMPYSRRKFDTDYVEEKIELGWNTYLGFILPQKSAVRAIVEKHDTVAEAIWLQNRVNDLLLLFDNPSHPLSACQIFDAVYGDSKEHTTQVMVTLQERDFLERRKSQYAAQIASLKKELAPYFETLTLNYEKLLLTDLYRLAVDASRFNSWMNEHFGKMTLEEFRGAAARFGVVLEALKTLSKEVFVENDFRKWRQDHSKAYLAEKRKQEKEANQKYARPYIEYLDKARQEMFKEFWERYQWDLCALFLKGTSTTLPCAYQENIGNWFKELSEGAHTGLNWVASYHRLHEVVEKFDEGALISFLQTLRGYDQLTRPLLGKYSGLKGGKEKDLAAAFYPTYGLGYARSQAFRQSTTIGSIFKLVCAYETLRQRYLTLKEKGESLANLNPLVIVDDKHRVGETWNVGFHLDGRPIPMFYHGGRLPRSDHPHIGKIDLVRALETSSNPYFAILSGDFLEDPEDLCAAANLFGYGEKTGIDLPGEYAGRLPLDVAYNRTGLYSMSMGQHTLVGTPLQTAVMLAAIANQGAVLKPQIIKKEGELLHKPQEKWRIFMPAPIRNLLISGLRQVVMGEKGTARQIRHLYNPTLASQIIGKTSTAEVIERMSLDGANGRMKLKHVCFGAIAYDSTDEAKPELIVVTYLRYGDWGKDAAPLAVEMVKKWREIKAHH